MTREKGIRNSKEGGRDGWSSEKREEKRVVRLLQNIRGWIWHILWQSVGFSRMARGRTNLDGYLLTHTAFCYRTELSLACTRGCECNLLTNSLPPAHCLSSPPSRQYCIVLKPRLVLRLDKSRRTTYPGVHSVSSSILPLSIPSPHRVILPPPCTRSTPWRAAESRTRCIIHGVI